MSTETIETSATEQAKAQAAKQVQALCAECDRLQNRKKTTAEELTRLDDEIAKAERAGVDAKILSALRRDRTELQSVSADLDRVMSHIETELVPARADLRAATIAGCAAQYNRLAEKQSALQDVISEAIDTLVQAVRAKEGLAHQQRAIQTGDLASLGFQSPERSVDTLRPALLALIEERLLNPKELNEFMKASSIQKIDWPSRTMRADGVVE